MRLQVNIYIGLFTLIVSACDLINPEEAFPAYITINKAEVKISKGSNFTSEVGVKDIWVERGDEFLGIYQIPSTFPVYPNDRREFFVWGGIFNNGLSASRARYPFWKPVSYDLDLMSLDTVNLSPTFEYFSDTLLAMPFVESFEGASTKFADNSSGANTVQLRRSNLMAFQGNRSGHARFTAGVASSFEVVSGDFFVLPQGASNDVYAEITYKNNIPFSVGVKYASAFEVGERSDGLSFNSNMEWNTIYIHLKPLIQAVPSPSAFGLFIRAQSNGEEGDIFLDNIRVIHFK